MQTSYKLYTYFAVLFAVNMVVTGTIVTKMFSFYGFIFSAAIIIFPVSYILGDVLTEVYGYKNTRKIIWSGFATMVFATIITQIAIFLPDAPGYDGTHFNAVFETMPRIIIGGLAGYFCGEYTNSIVLSRLKVLMEGKMLWVRTIGSTVIGEGVDTIVFAFIAFYGILPNEILFSMISSGYVFKVFYEILVTPITYRIVAYVKKVEGVDVYDRNVKYTII